MSVDPISILKRYDRFRYEKDAEGHEHDPANGQFTNQSGGTKMNPSDVSVKFQPHLGGFTYEFKNQAGKTITGFTHAEKFGGEWNHQKLNGGDGNFPTGETLAAINSAVQTEADRETYSGKTAAKLVQSKPSPEIRDWKSAKLTTSAKPNHFTLRVINGGAEGPPIGRLFRPAGSSDIYIITERKSNYQQSGLDKKGNKYFEFVGVARRATDTEILTGTLEK